MSGPKIADIQIVDNFCPEIEEVKASFLASGYGTWEPSQSIVGDGKYAGLSFMGKHQHMLRALCMSLNRMVMPGTVFSKCAVADERPAYVHSDRNQGDYTCVCYLTDHGEEKSGTAFYRHRRTGLREMPDIGLMKATGSFDSMSYDMTNPSDEVWEMLDFVRGIYNRAVIFRAPLFHSRIPMTGIGTSPKDGRICWVSHFYLE